MQATALDGLGQFEAAGRAYTQAAQEACAMGGVMDGHTWPSKEAADFMQAMMKGTKEILLEKARAAFAKAGQGSASTEPDGDIVAATLVAHMARIMSGDSRPVTMLHYQLRLPRAIWWKPLHCPYLGLWLRSSGLVMTAAS